MCAQYSYFSANLFQFHNCIAWFSSNAVGLSSMTEHECTYPT